MTRFVLTCLFVAGAAPAAPAAAPAGGDACELLTVEEVRSVQGAAVKERKPSAHQRQGLRFAQCVFATDEFARSVSLSLITGPAESAVRAYWNNTFRPHKPSPRKSPPRPIEGVGAEAFWSGDARTGSLYVLVDGAILRVSVGGVQDENERIRRSTTLAESALKRLHSTH